MNGLVLVNKNSMKKVKKNYCKFETGFLIFLLIAMSIVLFTQIIVRYFLQISLLWSEELARYLQVSITFLGIGFGIRQGSHIAMTLITKKLSLKIQSVLSITVNIISILAFLLIFQESISFVIYQHNILASTLRIPMSYVVAVVPLSCIIFVLYALNDILVKCSQIFNISKRR